MRQIMIGVIVRPQNHSYAFPVTLITFGSALHPRDNERKGKSTWGGP